MARRHSKSKDAATPSRAYVLTDSQLTIKSTKATLEDPEIVGRKGAGLALLPDPWRPPYVVLSAQALNEAIAARNGAELVLCRLLERAIDLLGVTQSARIICRSSVPDEGLERRGRYKSIATSPEVSLAAQAAAEIHRDALAKGSDGCAVIVQQFLRTDANGHLSNEFRHAQRNVDFLFEVEEAMGAVLSGLRSQETYAFRLPRPVRTPIRIQALRLEEFRQDLRSCLMFVAKWSCNVLDRGHFEWVLSDGRLWFVQFDPESKRWKDPPLEAWKAQATSEFMRTLRVFERLTPAPEYDRWRKTRSHRILTTCHLFVPPIYILSSKNVIVEIVGGEISPALEEDLRALVTMPLMIRFDVDTALGEDWTNLPVGGPFLDYESATRFLLEGVAKTISRGTASDGLAVVCHHFIPARAAAWATSRPNDARVKIDSIWGLPDGLQAFPYDTCVVDLEKGTIGRFDRYKDEFIDIDKDGKWVTRLTTDSRARSACLSDEHATRIAAETRAVAVARNQPTRVMWFIDTDKQTLSTPVVPWILTDEEDSPEGFWLETSPEGEPDIEQLKKRIMLGGVRRLRDVEDLDAFAHSSQKFDLGGRCVLFRPTALLLRNEDFLMKVAEVLKSHGQQWFLVFEGSLLAHAPYRLRSLGVRVISIWEYNRPPRSKSIRKLVRDLIPEKIRAHGESVLAVRLSRHEHIEELRRKLVEESLEAFHASGAAEVADELADVLAVAQSLAQTMGIAWHDVVQKEIEKRRARGGFSQGIFVAKTAKATELQNLDPRKVTSAGVERLRYRPGIVAPLIPPNPRPDGWSFKLSIGDHEIRIRVKYSRTSIRVELGSSDGGPQDNPDQLKLF